MSDVTMSHAIDEKELEQSPSHTADDAAASQQLKMPLNADTSHKIDGVLTENSSNSSVAVAADPVEATVAAASSHMQCWTSAGFVSERPSDIASDHLQSLSVGDQLTSADSDDLPVSSSSSSRQMFVFSGSDLASVNHATHCEPVCQCYLENSEPLTASSEQSELFSCRECSVSCSKHFAHDSLRIVLRVVRHSEVDCSVFGDASLTVVKNEIYHTKVISQICSAYFFCVVAVLKSVNCSVVTWLLLMSKFFMAITR